MRQHDQLVAETHAPRVLYESGFAPRWYLPRADVVAEALILVSFEPEVVEPAPSAEA